jgi:Holliday junction resolvase RusA-like endonuclease
VKSLSWTATFAPPHSWSKKKRVELMGTPHRNKPDASNILKGIEDILWADGDEGLFAGSYRKVWGWENKIELLIELETP